MPCSQGISRHRKLGGRVTPPPLFLNALKVDVKGQFSKKISLALQYCWAYIDLAPPLPPEAGCGTLPQF